MQGARAQLKRSVFQKPKENEPPRLVSIKMERMCDLR
jgi:hypothetical protein